MDLRLSRHRSIDTSGRISSIRYKRPHPNDPNHKNFKDRERILNRVITERKGEQYGSTSHAGKPCKK